MLKGERKKIANLESEIENLKSRGSNTFVVDREVPNKEVTGIGQLWDTAGIL